MSTGLGQVQRLRTVVCQRHFVALQAQQLGQGLGHVKVVIDDQGQACGRGA